VTCIIRPESRYLKGKFVDFVPDTDRLGDNTACNSAVCFSVDVELLVYRFVASSWHMNYAPPIAPSFDEKYISGLLEGDPEIEKHFAAHFSQELDHWLKGRVKVAAAVEDVRQETLRRVLETVHRGKALQKPEHLTCFVHGVCRRVLLEYWRKTARFSAQGDISESSDDSFDPEQAASAAEDACRLRTALLALPPNSRQLLSMIYFEERDRAEVSRSIGVDRGYLRVMIHRALRHLRDCFLSGGSS
jgi:RNA polymerase sigma-70 factor, ECF subfamily